MARAFRGPSGLAVGQGAELREHLFRVGVTAGRLLRVDEVAVDGDLEHAAAGWDQGDLRRRVFELLEDLRRQTDGSVEVASDGAVFDRDLHLGISSGARPGPQRFDEAMLIQMGASRTGVLEPAPPLENLGGGGGRWAWLLTARDAVEAEIVRGLLEGAGVPVALDWRDPSPFAWMHLSGNLFRPVPVYVPASLIDSARLQLLELGLDAPEEQDDEDDAGVEPMRVWRERHRILIAGATGLTIVAVGWIVFAEIFGFAPCLLRLFCF